MKYYYRITFKLETALNIGNGENVYTDKDILRNSKGDPFIPASSLAGVYESFFLKNDPNGNFQKWFGTEKDEQVATRIRIYDAEVKEKTFATGYRDNVALDEFRTAIASAKFDHEVIEPGAEFTTYIEVDHAEEDPGYVKSILSFWQSGDIYLGGKTARGQGAVSVLSMDYAMFDLTKAEDVTKWLDFDMYANPEKVWNPCTSYSPQPALLKDRQIRKITLELKQKGAISIRRYTTEVNPNTDDNPLPDFKQLKVRKIVNDQVQEGDPVVPGTSWAGAFRHRMSTLVEESKITQYFGTHENQGKKSIIRFRDSMLTAGTDKQITRTAIDRVTGGASDKSLYTERTYYNGNTNLQIEFSEAPDTEIWNTLAFAIADLDAGFLVVGGLSSVGRGLFTVQKVFVDGIELTVEGIPGTLDHAQSLYQALTEKAERRQNG